MDSLAQRAWTGVLKFQIALAVLLFLPAMTLAYWQGWLYWLVLLLSIAAITGYFLRYDPALVARRQAAGPVAEPRRQQKLIQAANSVLICASIIVSALDQHFAWSVSPPWVALAGEVLVALGFAGVFVTLRANSFAAAVVQVETGQRIVETGPYALLRHPMYAASLLIFLGTPPALGSWWGLVPALLIVVAMAWRLIDEERCLERELPGYDGYRRKVCWRLVPWVW